MYRTVSATYSVIVYCQWERRVVDTLQFIPRRNVPSRDLTCPLIMQDWKITDRIGHDFLHFQLGHFSQVKQKTQLSLTNRATHLEVSQGHQTWYHSV